MIKEIVKYGDTRLREETVKVTEINEEIFELLDDLRDSMIEAHGVGIAAPQLGISKKVFITEVPEKELKEVINPKILWESDKTEESEEGCLSIPGVRKKVRRPVAIEVEYLNRKGEVVKEKLEDFDARAFLHEYDHLIATLFVDRIGPTAKRLVSSKLKKLAKESKKNQK